MPVRPLTVEELDQTSAAGCENPACEDPDCGGTLFLTQKCHPGAGVFVGYEHGSSELEITCRACDAHIARVAVAHE